MLYNYNRIVSVDIQVSPRNVNLGGEVEFWMEDEKHIITKTCLVFIPKSVKHCPLIFRRIDTPIFMFEAGNSAVYDQII